MGKSNLTGLKLVCRTCSGTKITRDGKPCKICDETGYIPIGNNPMQSSQNKTIPTDQEKLNLGGLPSTA